MLNLPASLTLPGNAQIFGTEFLPGSTSYMLGPKSATCQGYLASVDGGGLTRITNAGSAADVPIDYSSDGRQIVFGLCRVKTHSPSLSWYFALVRLPCGIR